MSILDPTTGELFTLRIYKAIDVASDQVWANTYELRANEGADNEDLRDAANRLVDFEKELHLDTAVFNRYVLSTFVADGEPYDPTSFISQPLSGAGLTASPIAAETLPLQVVLYVRREVATGRTGKAFYRQALAEGDVQGRFGQVQLTSPAGIQSRVDDAVATAMLAPLLGGGGGAVTLVMATTDASPIVRDITGLSAVSGRIVKYNNRYFDVA